MRDQAITEKFSTCCGAPEHLEAGGRCGACGEGAGFETQAELDALDGAPTIQGPWDTHLAEVELRGVLIEYAKSTISDPLIATDIAVRAIKKQARAYPLLDEMVKALQAVRHLHQRYCDRVGASELWASQLQQQVADVVDRYDLLRGK